MSAAWYCRIRGQQVGPLSSAGLKALATTGDLLPENLVRQGSSGQWVTAARVKGLFSATPGRGSPTDAAHGSSATADPSANLLEGLDDLTPLPASPASLPSIGSLPGGEAAGFFDDLPTGQPASPGGPLSGGNRVPLGRPVATRLPFGTPTRGAASAAALRGSSSSEKDAYSTARVGGVAIVAIFFGFAGVCTLTIRNVRADLSIVPVVFGIAGTILALRAVMLASRKDSLSLGLCLIALAVGVVAAGGGLYQMRASDWNHLLNQAGAARTGAPLPRTGPRDSATVPAAPPTSPRPAP